MNKRLVSVTAAIVAISIFVTTPIQTLAYPITPGEEQLEISKADEEEKKSLDISMANLYETCEAGVNSAWEESRITLKDIGIKDTYIKPEYIQMAREIITQYFPDLPLALVIAVIESESSGRAWVVNYLGCKGLMQVYEKVNKDRMKKYGVTNLLDPYSNILVGCDILYEKYQKWNGNLYGTLMNYNGSKNVKKRVAAGDYSSYSKKIVKRTNELKIAYY